MTDFLFSLACLSPLVVLFVRGSRHEMFTPTPWTYRGYLNRRLKYVTRYAFTQQMLDMFCGENPVAVLLRNSQVRR
jgi:hypothetical protein